MKTDRIRLHEPVVELCERLGLPYVDTAEILIRPAEVRAVVYLTRDGKKYVDEKSGEAATETRTFKVTT